MFCSFCSWISRFHFLSWSHIVCQHTAQRQYGTFTRARNILYSYLWPCIVQLPVYRRRHNYCCWNSMEITLSSGYYWKHTQHFAGCQISCHRRERLTRGCREIPSCSCRKRNFWRTRAFTETTLHVPKQSSYFAVRVEPAGQAASQQDALIHTHHGSFKYPPKTYSRVKAASCCPGKWHFQPSHSASLCQSPFSILVWVLISVRKEEGIAVLTPQYFVSWNNHF